MLRPNLGVTAAAALIQAALLGALAAEEPNRLRNGSFEGSLLYWHGIDPNHHRLVEGKVPDGRMALRIERGLVMSAPFVAEHGADFTVSFHVRGERPGEVRVQMPPSAREVGTKHKRLWMREATKSAPITAEWKRVSFTWKADLPTEPFWPLPHYMVLIESDGSGPIEVDGVTVTGGTSGSERYHGYRRLETVAECLDWPGYEGASGSLFEPGAKVRIAQHAFRPARDGGKPASDAAEPVTLRWQLFDYEGLEPVGLAIERAVTLKPGESVRLIETLTLTRLGCQLARVSVLAEGKVIDSSDLPLTALAHPKKATTPDPRERFGGSFAGGLGTVRKFQRLGFGWIRWRPHANGEDHLPVKPNPGEPWRWTWFDKELDEQEAHGCSSHLVLYPPPKWIMEPGHPLPVDMRWKGDDPRWNDLGVETVWDRFVRGAVERYGHRPVIFEIENEPEFDRWTENGLEAEYARFTMRTARLIKRTRPNAKVMINNVYGIPSAINGALFAVKDWARDIDVISWHDYHGGWLTDARGIRRMRQNLDEAGGKHVEIWFNEGWAFTNTAVDEPPACDGLTSAQSTNMIMASVAELSAVGQKKTVLFHTAYDTHGMSFWDYSGPGTMLWDWYNYPLPLVGAWNVMIHHVGLSEEAGLVRPPGASFAVFQDLRNGRGVIVAYADQGAAADVTITLPESLAGLVVEDIMGNAKPLAGSTLKLSKSGRLVYLHHPDKLDGTKLLKAVEPLDRRHVGFAGKDAGGRRSWSLPPTWEGKAKDSSDGADALADGKPIWRLRQIWPADPLEPANWKPMVWTGTDWNVREGGFGGQPGAVLKDGVLAFGTRAPHGQPMALRTAGLVFAAAEAGAYELSAGLGTRIWDGGNDTELAVYRKSPGGVERVGGAVVPNGATKPLELRVDLAAGEELGLVPIIQGAYSGGTLELRNVRVTRVGPASPKVNVVRLPMRWEGRANGSVDGNPQPGPDGKPRWRLDTVRPRADPIFPASYEPLVWTGKSWEAKSGGQGGQPAAIVREGKANLSVRGPWAGPDVEHVKTAAVVFVVPSPGVWRIRGTASAKKWEGGASSVPLQLRKRDAQRVAELNSWPLPTDGKPVRFEAKIDAALGHELFLMPWPGEYHCGIAVEIAGLELVPE
jgi:hypothetical protein